MPGKSIVVLLDGTSNGIDTDRTNILRLYGCLTKSPSQLVYYDPGVGTMASFDYLSRLARRFSKLRGLATGHGIDQNVKEAYRFLVENYQHEAGDEIYLFGFSRGAYTARMLAGFIYTIGLIEPRNLNLLDYTYRAYKRIGEQSGSDAFNEISHYQKVLQADHVPINFLGLFDIVASVIERSTRRIWPLYHLKSHAYVTRNPGVKVARQAAALDERRKMFRPMLWPERQPYHLDPLTKSSKTEQNAKEVWFSGSHGDVGGGYPETESGLAKIALIWMIEEASVHGLEIEQSKVELLVRGGDPKRLYVKPDAYAPIHNSMMRVWRILELLPRPQKFGESKSQRFANKMRRKVPDGARIHASVVVRAEKEGALPRNVPENHLVEGNADDWR